MTGVADQRAREAVVKSLEECVARGTGGWLTAPSAETILVALFRQGSAATQKSGVSHMKITEEDQRAAFSAGFDAGHSAARGGEKDWKTALEEWGRNRPDVELSADDPSKETGDAVAAPWYR